MVCVFLQELYVQGEWLDGDNKYFCSQCGKRVDTLKRVCIKDLPRHLILHLKRFEFDLEHFVKYKINDKVTFPFELDMAPYTVDGVANAERAQQKSAPASQPASSSAATSVRTNCFGCCCCCARFYFQRCCTSGSFP